MNPSSSDSPTAPECAIPARPTLQVTAPNKERTALIRQMIAAMLLLKWVGSLDPHLIYRVSASLVPLVILIAFVRVLQLFS